MQFSSTTQKQRVLDRINEIGCVDNFWAIQNYILRLGAIIHDLTKEGWVFRRVFGDNNHKKNSYYYPLLRPGETQLRII